jgi:hypothetical protein
MRETDLFLLFIQPLNRAGVRYVIGGSVAAMFYGEPRLTRDVDVMIFLNEPTIRQLPEIFPASEFYLPPQETIFAESARPQHGQFNIIHLETMFKADIYPTGRDEFNAWAFRNKRPVVYEGETLVLAPPEYVIVRKLEYFREGGSDKHLRDIRGILNISGEQLNQADLQEWIRRRGVEAEWRKVAT